MMLRNPTSLLLCGSLFLFLSRAYKLLQLKAAFMWSTYISRSTFEHRKYDFDGWFTSTAVLSHTVDAILDTLTLSNRSFAASQFAYGSSTSSSNAFGCSALKFSTDDHSCFLRSHIQDLG